MRNIDANLSTGFPGLDKILTGLIPGDNLVWQVETVQEDTRMHLFPRIKTSKHNTAIHIHGVHA